MSLGKNISHCKRYVAVVPARRLNSGSSSTIDVVKMHAKSVVLNQWKLINELKIYFSKITTDKTFENALNKEFAQFLQKIDAKTYGKDLIRYFTANATAGHNVEKSNNSKGKPEETKSFPSVLNGLKINIGKEEVKKDVPKWKTARSYNTSRDCVSTQTSQVVKSISLAQRQTDQLTIIEDLISHLKTYPESRHDAVKEGAIRLLLRIRQNVKDPDLQGPLNEAFALLGYADPVPGAGIRILSIDGGGVRGILVIEMLRKLEELSGKKIYEMFDLICGVSTGAIVATLIGLKHKSLNESLEIYKSISTQIFTQSTIRGTSNLVWSHSYYDTALWEKLLQEQWNDKLLTETQRTAKTPKFCAVSAVVNQSRLSAYVFRNYSLPCKVQSQYLGGCGHKVWESVRASAAAPTYFEEFKIGNMLHQDGGILVNNPTAVAIHEAKLLWPTMPIQCVVSFGTGRTSPIPLDTPVQPCTTPVNNSSWKKKFFAIIDSATDTEGVHTMLSDLLPGNVYYRFNPYLTEMLDIAEIDPCKLEQLERDALMYLRRNEDKFQGAVKALSIQKKPLQKFLDWLNIQKQIHAIQI